MARLTGILDNVPVRLKLSGLVAASLLALSTCVFTSVHSDSVAGDTATSLRNLNTATSDVLALDRLASELKVNGLEAVIRADPTAQNAVLRTDLAEAADLLQQLAAVPLPSALHAAVERINAAYTGYTAVITRYVNGAAIDQAQALLSWEQIGVDNYLTSAVLQNERGVFTTTVARASKAADTSRSNARLVMWITVVVTALILCLLAGIVVVSITRPLRRV